MTDIKNDITKYINSMIDVEQILECECLLGLAKTFKRDVKVSRKLMFCIPKLLSLLEDATLSHLSRD